MKIYKSTVTSKGQITIPKQIREAIALYEKDEVIFEQHGDIVILKPALKDITKLVGVLNSESKPYDKTNTRKNRAKVRGKKYATQNSPL